MADLTLRLTKGSPVTFAEMDSNLLALDSDSPWKVSDGHITYHGKVGMGYGVDSNYRPKYHLDFGFGDSNGEVKVGTFADLGLHLDSSSTFSIYNDGSQSVTVDDQGRVGVGINTPNQPLDVAGNIQSTATVIANQGFFQSVYDGFMTISNGSISNGVDASMSGTVSFGQLSDQTNTITRFEIDKVSGSAAILPASSAVKFSIDSAVAGINNAIDSEHAWANNYISNVDSNAIARDDSDRIDLIAQIDSDHSWANTYISNVDSDAKSRDDSEHTWALSYLGDVDSALDSEHAWNVLSHNTLQNNIDSEHGYAHTQVNLLNARADSEHGWANTNFDSEHTWNVTSHNQLQANIDSDHLWALRKFDSEHGYAVNLFDSEHFWAKKYIEDGDSVVDSELQKQFRIQKTLDDSEHAWNVAEHGELQQNIDSRADSEHRWNVAKNQELQSNIDSDHDWANNYISAVDIAAQNRDDSEHGWAKNYISTVDIAAQNRDDSEHAWASNYISTVDTNARNRDDSEHAWASNYISTVDTNAKNRDDSEHAWASNYISTVDTNAKNRDDSEHGWANTNFNLVNNRVDSEHQFVVSSFANLTSNQDSALDSEHAWNVAEHTQLRSEIDSDHAWANTNFNLVNDRLDSEHLYVVTSFSNLTSNQDSALDSDHAWAVSQFDSTWNAIRAIDSANDSDRGKRFDSEHAWNITEHTQLRAEIDSDHAWAVSQLDSEHSWNVAEHLALSNADSNLGDRLDSLSGYVNTFVAVEIAKLDSNLDSEHAWNVAEHDALQVDIDSVYSQLQTLTAGVYNSSDFDSDLATKTTDDVAEGTTNLYYTTARTDSDAKRAVSAGNGLDYDSSTGVFRTDSTASVQFDNLVLSGDLTVNGTTNTINVENLNVSNSRIGLNDSLVGAPTNDAGIIINRGTDSNAFIGLDETNDKFTLGFTVESAGENGIITDLTVGTLVANIEGNVTGQVSDISNHTTDGLAEGSTNLYFTVDRWDSALDSAIAAGKISAAISGLSNTDSLPEGTTNLYYTQARAKTDFDSGFATKSTDDLAEGTTNVYYTTARFDSALDSAIAAGKIATENYNNTDSLPEGTTNLYYTVARSDSDFSKNLDSAIAAGKIATLSNTDSLPEGTTNLYYTTARQDSDTLVLVDSAYVQARQQYVTLDSTAPTTPFDGELWLDRNVDAVKIYDGSVWFDLPTSSTFDDSNIIVRLNGHDSDILRIDSAISNISGLTIDSTQPTGPIDGDLWLDKNVDLVKIYDGSVWFDFPVGAGFDDSNIIIRLSNLDSDVLALRNADSDILASIDNISGLTIDSTQPTDPIDGDLWLDKNVDVVKIYDGSVWFDFPASGGGSGTIDSAALMNMIDSDYIQLRQNYMEMDSTAPSTAHRGEFWLDKNVDVVKVYDGSVWFEFPAGGGFTEGQIISMVDSALAAGTISLDASPTGGASDDF